MQGTVTILPFPGSLKQRRFGRVIGPNIKKTENLSYEEKEQNGDTSPILTVRIFFKYVRESKANSDINCSNPNDRSLCLVRQLNS